MFKRNLDFFGRFPPYFSLEKQPKKVNFQKCLPLRDPLVATFNETCAPTSRKYVAGQSIVMPN